MKLSEIQTLWQIDSKIDKLNLGTESVRTSTLFQKYLDIRTSFSLLLGKLKRERKCLYRQKWEFFAGKMDDDEMDVLGWEYTGKKILKQNLSIYLEADPALQDHDRRIEYADTVVDYLDRVLKQLGSRDWQIRNTIQWESFIQGVT